MFYSMKLLIFNNVKVLILYLNVNNLNCLIKHLLLQNFFNLLVFTK